MSGPEHVDPAPLPQWQAARLATLLGALGSIPISGAERASLTWLAGFEAATVENVAGVIRRAQAVILAKRAARDEPGIQRLRRQLIDLCEWAGIEPGEDPHGALLAHLLGREPVRSRPTYVSHSSAVQAVATSFGYLHGGPPKADIVVDVRDYLRDPHVDPAFRTLTGHDRAVMERVLVTPGAQGLIDALVAAADALLPRACKTGRLVQIAIGCAGGRHRSVVIADAVAARLALAGWGTEAEHLHIAEPVVDR